MADDLMMESNSSNFTNSTVLTVGQMLDVSYTEISTTSLSIIGSSSIIISTLWKKKICQPEVHPIFHLSLADLLASTFLLIGCSLYVSAADSDRDYSLECSLVIGLSMTFFLCTFLLTLTYGIEVYIRMRERLKRKPMRESIYGHFPSVYSLYCLSWVIPIICAIALLACTIFTGLPKKQNETGKCRNFECVLLAHHRSEECVPDGYLMWYFVSNISFLLPLLLVLLGNLAMYFLTHRALKQRHLSRAIVGPRQYIDAARVRNRAILYCSIFSICWLPSVVLGLVSFTNGFSMQSFFWLYILQGCTAPLQGLLNCIIYGWQRRGFQTAVNIIHPHTQLEKTRASSMSGDFLLPGYKTFSNI
ncbi:transmembrane protein 116-like [Glandiceps talaboti]